MVSSPIPEPVTPCFADTMTQNLALLSASQFPVAGWPPGASNVGDQASGWTASISNGAATPSGRSCRFPGPGPWIQNDRPPRNVAPPARVPAPELGERVRLAVGTARYGRPGSRRSSEMTRPASETGDRGNRRSLPASSPKPGDRDDARFTITCSWRGSRTFLDTLTASSAWLTAGPIVEWRRPRAVAFQAAKVDASSATPMVEASARQCRPGLPAAGRSAQQLRPARRRRSHCPPVLGHLGMM